MDLCYNKCARLFLSRTKIAQNTRMNQIETERRNSMSAYYQREIDEIREILRTAQSVVFFGGAGVSTESGIADIFYILG